MGCINSGIQKCVSFTQEKDYGNKPILTRSSLREVCREGTHCFGLSTGLNFFLKLSLMFTIVLEDDNLL